MFTKVASIRVFKEPKCQYKKRKQLNSVVNNNGTFMLFSQAIKNEKMTQLTFSLARRASRSACRALTTLLNSLF